MTNRIVSDLIGTMRNFFMINPSSDSSSPSSGTHKAGELTVNASGHLYLCTSSGTPGTWRRISVIDKKQIVFTVSGELETSTGSLRIYNRYGFTLTITEVFLSVGTPSVGSNIKVNVKNSGTTIFETDTYAEITATEYTTSKTTGLTSEKLFEHGDYLTVDIVAVGSTTAGSDLTIIIVAEA